MPVTKFGPLKATGAEINTGTDDAKFVTAKAIADSTIGKAWTAWTPAWTGLTVGNATNTGWYTKIGKTVHFRIYFIWGNTTSASGNTLLTLPVTPATYGIAGYIGNCHFYDSGTATWVGFVRSDGYFGHLTNANTQGVAVVSNTAPFTWTTGDKMMIVGTYEAA